MQGLLNILYINPYFYQILNMDIGQLTYILTTIIILYFIYLKFDNYYLLIYWKKLR